MILSMLTDVWRTIKTITLDDFIIKSRIKKIYIYFIIYFLAMMHRFISECIYVPVGQLAALIFFLIQSLKAAHIIH